MDYLVEGLNRTKIPDLSDQSGKDSAKQETPS